MERLRYEAIRSWTVVTGYEVRLSDGWRGVGETIDEAVKAAEAARDAHSTRVYELRQKAEQLHKERETVYGPRPF